MIVAVCKEDGVITGIVKQATTYNKLAFGEWCTIQEAKTRKLKQNEDLFLVARNAEFSVNSEPLIGSRPDHVMLNAVQLLSLVNIFPTGYTGSVFVYVAVGDAGGQATRRLINQIKTILSQVFPLPKYYMHVGHGVGHIPSPRDTVWVKI